jgi:Putative auto-transporter adhesin, head GIN domain
VRAHTLVVVAVASSLVVLGGACTDDGVVTGSGQVVERTVPTSPFDRLQVGAAFQVRVTIGEPESVTVRIDDNLVDRLDAAVVDETLHIRLEPSTSFRDATLQADVVVSTLSSIEVAGASSVRVAGSLETSDLRLGVTGTSTLDLLVDATSINLGVHGASTVTLSGSASELSATVVGASSVSASDLTAGTLDADIDGASTVIVHVTTSISAQVSGASTLLYGGTPKILSQDVTGASTIAPL